MLSIRELFDAADAVVLIQVEDDEQLYEENDHCATRYTATIIESFKGGDNLVNMNAFKFGRNLGLLKYRTYLLFLNYEIDEKYVYNKLLEKFGFPDDRKNIMDLIKCKGTVPGYVFDQKVAWEVLSGYIRIIGLRPENIPSNIHLFEAETAVWLIPKNELFSYLRRLRR
jgi:hypothetical protein